MNIVTSLRNDVRMIYKYMHYDGVTNIHRDKINTGGYFILWGVFSW